MFKHALVSGSIETCPGKESYEEKRNKKIMGISMCSVNGSSGLVRMYKERGRNQGDFGEGSGRDN